MQMGLNCRLTLTFAMFVHDLVETIVGVVDGGGSTCLTVVGLLLGRLAEWKGVSFFKSGFGEIFTVESFSGCGCYKVSPND